jgi:uncharacterized PurR-regulated membrane protein YhhQ (DUF165 family)
MSIVLWILLPLAALLAAFFLPKWLYWISPRAYSVYDVLSEQYGRRTALWIILLTAAVLSGVFFLLEYGSHAGW